MKYNQPNTSKKLQQKTNRILLLKYHINRYDDEEITYKELEKEINKLLKRFKDDK